LTSVEQISKQKHRKYEKTRQHDNSNNNHTTNDLNNYEISNIDIKRMMIRMINEMKEDMYKHLNEFKEDTQK
jgi:hypothetical protein